VIVRDTGRRVYDGSGISAPSQTRSGAATDAARGERRARSFVKEESSMFPTGSALPERDRSRICDGLNAVLADSIDLYSQIKVAHWNVKGPNFKPVHELLDELAESVEEQIDIIAERSVALGGRALGTSRHVAKTSRLAEYPQDTSRDLDHVRLVAERFESVLTGVRKARDTAEELGDTDSVDLLTVAATAFEKHVWFLRATLE
jgi:starvation-inducible DNA-binding protein